MHFRMEQPSVTEQRNTAKSNKDPGATLPQAALKQQGKEQCLGGNEKYPQRRRKARSYRQRNVHRRHHLLSNKEEAHHSNVYYPGKRRFVLRAPRKLSPIPEEFAEAISLQEDTPSSALETSESLVEPIKPATARWQTIDEMKSVFMTTQRAATVASTTAPVGALAKAYRQEPMSPMGTQERNQGEIKPKQSRASQTGRKLELLLLRGAPRALTEETAAKTKLRQTECAAQSVGTEVTKTTTAGAISQAEQEQHRQSHRPARGTFRCIIHMSELRREGTTTMRQQNYDSETNANFCDKHVH